VRAPDTLGRSAPQLGEVQLNDLALFSRGSFRTSGLRKDEDETLERNHGRTKSLRRKASLIVDVTSTALGKVGIVVRLYNVFAESQHALRIIGIYKNDFIIF
jgi:hypothetical protein